MQTVLHIQARESLDQEDWRQETKAVDGWYSWLRIPFCLFTAVYLGTGFFSVTSNTECL